MVFAFESTNHDLEVILSFVMQLPQKFSLGPYETHHAGETIYHPKHNLVGLCERTVANIGFFKALKIVEA